MLALATLALMGRPFLPPARLLPRLALVAVGVVLSFPLPTALACVLAFVAMQGAYGLGRADALLLAAVLLCDLGYAEGGALARELGGVRVICLALALSLPVTAALALAGLDAAVLARATPVAWAGFAYLSVISTVAGFFAWYRGLALGGVARVGQLQLAQPVLSLV